VKNGKPFPLGSALSGTGANFSVYSSQATEVQLVLFDSELDAPADRIFKLDASVNRTAHYWHNDLLITAIFKVALNAPYGREVL
jgi:pullulanase/glycogen debranching enzyme